MRTLEFITGHVIYNPAYTYTFQLKTTLGFAVQKQCTAVPYLQAYMLSCDYSTTLLSKNLERKVHPNASS